jgi:hypothetical protein
VPNTNESCSDQKENERGGDLVSTLHSKESGSSTRCMDLLDTFQFRAFNRERQELSEHGLSQKDCGARAGRIG